LIRHANDAAILGTHEIDRRLPSAKANYDLVIEIGVRLKSWIHVWDE